MLLLADRLQAQYSIQSEQLCCFLQLSCRLNPAYSQNSYVAACSSVADSIQHTVRTVILLLVTWLQTKSSLQSEQSCYCLQLNCRLSPAYSQNSYVTACSSIADWVQRTVRTVMLLLAAQLQTESSVQSEQLCYCLQLNCRLSPAYSQVQRTVRTIMLLLAAQLQTESSVQSEQLCYCLQLGCWLNPAYSQISYCLQLDCRLNPVAVRTLWYCSNHIVVTTESSLLAKPSWYKWLLNSLQTWDVLLQLSVMVL